MTQSQKRIGLVGLSASGSWASRSHLAYLRTTPYYTITALQNSSKASAEAAAKEYSLPSVSTHADTSSLAADPNVDIVAVSVNVQGHYDVIKPALSAGKDVFAEWPLARNVAEAVELTALAKEKGVRTLVGLQARQSPTVLKAREFVKSGKLGKILSSTMHGYGVICSPVTTKDFEYTNAIENGANLVTIPMGHATDALCFVLGEFTGLSATIANHFPEIVMLDKEFKPAGTVKKTAHDYVAFTGTLVDGGVVDVTYSGGTSHYGKDFFWEINGTDGSLVMENAKIQTPGPATGGHIQMSQPTLKFVPKKENPFAPAVALEDVEVEKAGEWDQGDMSFGVGKAWDAFAGVGLDKGYTVTTFEDALVRHKMIEAIYRSAEKGTRESYL
ncbi:NAD-binding Rossmann fold oxidoreductase family protein [Melanomma pulvis-pyrius CBS 109.77]|uniref:NAD-binding Rossmann fold oxidoreductase family protein n=1 Tax=Melanomma pulvis-pyrius CBS 109.77 TaxID=1314802 RepID=A0A6A6WRD6_9PLEO|nr:NAD-binding Rossmann fold oxidoreductase family protein [Melanomma pulvis-pyrius CBS 109.77]